MDGPFQNNTMYLYGDSSHQPGAEDVSIWSETIVHSLPEDDRRAWLNQSISVTPWVSACELGNLEHFGIDRKPPDNGTGGGTTTYYQTETDGQVTSVDTDGGAQWRGQEGVNKYEDYLSRDENGMDATHSEFPLSDNGWDADHLQTERVKFWNKQQAQADDGDHQSGQRTTFEYENMDRVIVDYSNCYTNPDEPGWYRQASLSETYWGDEADTPTDDESAWPGGAQYAPVTYSHWVYICDCQSYDDAVNQLGEPPEMNGTKVANSDEFAQYYGEGGGEETATPGGGEDTATPGGSGGEDTATPGGSGGEDTATPGGGEDTATPGGGVDTATPGGGDGTPTAHGDPGTSETTSSDSTPATGGTDTVPGGGSGNGNANDGGEVTAETTETGQPGFGVLAALVAALAGALLLRRD